MSGQEPVITPIDIANSIIMMESRPADRMPDEIRGYYFDFVTEPEHYPRGAALVIQWAFQDGELIIAPPVHASEWAEHIMTMSGKDISMLPDVASHLFKVLELASASGDDATE